VTRLTSTSPGARRLHATSWLALGAALTLVTGCPVDNRLLGIPTGAAGDADTDDGGNGGSSTRGSGGDSGGADDIPERGGSSTKGHGGSGGSGTAGAGDDGGTSPNAGTAGSSIAGAGMAGSAMAGGAGLAGAGAGAGAGGLAGANGIGGMSGSGGQTGGNAGSSAGIGGAGASGMGGHAGASTVIVCGDIDQNGYDDCSETIARNSRFKSDVNGWQSDYRVVTAWSAEDADDKSDSGALSITFATQPENSPSMAGAWQCVPEIGLGFYQIGAKAFIPTGQGGGWAGINVFMFSDAECGGALVSGQSLRLEETSGSWLTISGDVHVPADAKSLALRLVAVKPGDQPAFNVLFDNVLLRNE